MIIEELIATHRLGKEKTWKQTHSDDKSRRQINMTSLVMRIEEDNIYITIVVTAHYIAK